MLLALLIGGILGWFLAARHIDHLLIIFYHFRFRSPRHYLELYNAQDSELSFEMMRGQKDPPKDYAEYLLWHQACRPQVGKTFKKYWGAIIGDLTRDYIILMVIPAVLFMSRWPYFILSFTLMHLGYFIHRHFVRQNKLGFYSILMQTLIINDIRKSNS